MACNVPPSIKQIIALSHLSMEITSIYGFCKTKLCKSQPFCRWGVPRRLIMGVINFIVEVDMMVANHSWRRVTTLHSMEVIAMFKANGNFEFVWHSGNHLCDLM